MKMYILICFSTFALTDVAQISQQLLFPNESILISIENPEILILNSKLSSSLST